MHARYPKPLFAQPGVRAHRDKACSMQRQIVQLTVLDTRNQFRVAAIALSKHLPTGCCVHWQETSASTTCQLLLVQVSCSQKGQLACSS